MIGCLIFAFLGATLIVPAGAELVGMALTWVGCALIRHGESLRAAYQAYVNQWRSY